MKKAQVGGAFGTKALNHFKVSSSGFSIPSSLAFGRSIVSRSNRAPVSSSNLSLAEQNRQKAEELAAAKAAQQAASKQPELMAAKTADTKSKGFFVSFANGFKSAFANLKLIFQPKQFFDKLAKSIEGSEREAPIPVPA